MEVCLITTAVEVDSDIMDVITVVYVKDKLFGLVIMNPDRYPVYSILGGLIYHNERLYILSDRIVQKALLATYYNN